HRDPVVARAGRAAAGRDRFALELDLAVADLQGTADQVQEVATVAWIEAGDADDFPGVNLEVDVFHRAAAQTLRPEDRRAARGLVDGRVHLLRLGAGDQVDQFVGGEFTRRHVGDDA